MSQSLATLAGLVMGALLFCLAATGRAGEAQPINANVELESRAQALSHKLRCLVCQNQSIAESDAELAQDLRQEVRKQLSEGKTETEIIDFLVVRYGDFVLYDPPLDARTLILWGAPIIFSLAGIALLGWRLRRRGLPQTALSEAQKHAAQTLLEDTSESERPA